MFSVFLDKEMLAVDLAGNVKNFGKELKHPGFFKRRLFFALVQQHLDPGVDEEGGKDVQYPVEVRDQRFPDQDQQSAHDDCAEDPPEQNPVLVHPRHPEAGKDQRHDENVVERKALFHQKAGEKVHSLVNPFLIDDKHPEHTGRQNVDNAQIESMPEVWHFVLAVEQKEVKKQQ